MNIQFDRVFLDNRWATKKILRPGDWTIIGIHKRWASWQSFEYQICFFGFSLRIWFFKRDIE